MLNEIFLNSLEPFNGCHLYHFKIPVRSSHLMKMVLIVCDSLGIVLKNPYLTIGMFDSTKFISYFSKYHSL